MKHDCQLKKGVLLAYHLNTQNQIEKDVAGILIEVKTKTIFTKVCPCLDTEPPTAAFAMIRSGIGL